MSVVFFFVIPLLRVSDPRKKSEFTFGEVSVWILAENLRVQPPLGPNEHVHSTQYTRRYDEAADTVVRAQKAATTPEEDALQKEAINSDSKRRKTAGSSPPIV